MPDSGPIPPGATIGILGGGQLGRMSALAAAQLGYRCHVFTPEPDSPAAAVCAGQTVAGWEDTAALQRFADAVDVITLEFENIPLPAAALLARLKPLRPGTRALEVAQDRLAEKAFLRSIDIPVAPYAPVAGPGGLRAAAQATGLPAVLKSTRLGYDGHGQTRVQADTDPAAAWAAIAGPMGDGTAAVLEAHIDFSMELSVVVARGTDGGFATYVPVQNRHADHILDTTIAPAPVDAATAERAEAMARRIAERLDYVGLLAVEMFLARSGELLVNELAPRPHNSGHWTMDACLTSQFENHIRAVCGLPLGSPERHADAEMRNLLGEAAHGWAEILADPRARLHLYGKRDARPGRKMGHVTWLKQSSR